METNNKLWCKEYNDYYGNTDPQYGGILTDLRKLPIGTVFHVANGCWDGEILSDDRILVYGINDTFIRKLTDEHHSLYLN